MAQIRINYVLIDFENVHVKSLSLLEGEHFRVRVFLGPKDTKLPVELVMAVQKMGNKAEYTTLEASGTNALDFQIAYYLGILSANEPNAYFHVISKDKGFDPLIQHLKIKGIYSSRSVSIEDMPCFAKKEVNGEKAVPIEQSQVKPNEVPAKPLPVLEKNFKLVQDDLIRRKASKPRRVKTLKSTMQAGSNCNNNGISAVVIEDAILSYIHQEILSSEQILKIIQKCREKLVVGNPEIELVDKRLEQLSKEINKLVDLFQSNIIDKETLKDRLTPLNDQKQIVRNTLDTLRGSQKAMDVCQKRKFTISSSILQKN